LNPAVVSYRDKNNVINGEVPMLVSILRHLVTSGNSCD